MSYMKKFMLVPFIFDDDMIWDVRMLIFAFYVSRFRYRHFGSDEFPISYTEDDFNRLSDDNIPFLLKVFLTCQNRTHLFGVEYDNKIYYERTTAAHKARHIREEHDPDICCEISGITDEDCMPPTIFPKHGEVRYLIHWDDFNNDANSDDCIIIGYKTISLTYDTRLTNIPHQYLDHCAIGLLKYDKIELDDYVSMTDLMTYFYNFKMSKFSNDYERFIRCEYELVDDVLNVKMIYKPVEM